MSGLASPAAPLPPAGRYSASHVPAGLSNRGAAFSTPTRPAMPRAGRTSASARCPMHPVDCERCDRGLGGFAFLVGTFSKQNVLVQAGHSPAQAWELTIGARSASAFWTLQMPAPGSWSSTFCRFMHTVLWTRSPPRTTRAADLWIAWRHWHQGRREWREPSLEAGSRGANRARHAFCASCLAQCRRDTPSCPAHVRAVDAQFAPLPRMPQDHMS